MRIAILCNDRLALPALDYLLSSGKTVAVGMPERVQVMQEIVKERCRITNTPFQLFHKKDLRTEILAWLSRWQPNVVFVKTFPWLIPAEALTVPEFGFINFHYAPLPAWRGSNPLFWMLRNRVDMAGVTVHEMNASFDEGAILLEQSMPIGRNINFGILYTQLAWLGVQLTVKLINDLAAGTLEKKEQDPSGAAWYAHPKPTDLFINWQTMEAGEIHALIRACNPWNKGAATKWKNWTFGITYASVTEGNGKNIVPGTILSLDSGTGFTIACKDGKVMVAEVVYCEEGFYPGYCISAFGLQKYDQLS